MATPQSTPIKQAKQVKLSIGVSAKSASLTSEYKRLLSDQHQRLSLKHQQDLDLLDDIRSYVKARLSIEKDYTNSLQKLAKQHSNYINKKFVLLAQLDQQQSPAAGNYDQLNSSHDSDEIRANKLISGSVGSNSGPSSGAIDNMDSKQHNSSSSGCNTTINSNKPSSLYKVWSDHINFLQLTSKNRSDQFEQLNLIVDKLKDIRQHKASIGKKCLDQHLKPIQEDLLLSLMDVEKAKKLYYEDESQAKKARENEEKIKKKKGLLTKFTDIQAKREKFSAQREANDIQSTQARNDYIMALAAANAYLKYYYQRDLNDFIHLIDDGVLDHCKIFMATLSECEINWLKYSLAHAQTWSKLINLTGSHQTNNIFLLCEQSKCLRTKQELSFEPCNNDPIQKISLEHNADYALQHEIDKWFTWFKKECRNLSQLMHQLDTYQHAFAEGKKSIEVNGQTIDDLEPKIVNLKQQIRKCEAAKLKAQARLSAIKDGGMQIEEWSDVELEIRADMARAQEEQQQQARRLKEMRDKSMDDSSMVHGGGGGSSSGRRTGGDYCDDPSSSVHDGQYGADQGRTVIQLQVSKDSDDSDLQARGEGGGESMHNLASVSRSNSNLMQKQRNAMTGYSALTDPSLVWQDDQSAAWGEASATPVAPSNVAVSPHSFNDQSQQQQQQPQQPQQQQQQQHQQQSQQQPQLLTDKQKQIPNASMSIQSSSPLSAIMNGGQHLSQSPYQGIMSEAYKSDYECDYSRSGQHASIRSAASSAEPTMHQTNRRDQQQFAGSPGDIQERMDESQFEREDGTGCDLANLLNKRVVALYTFDKDNHDDLPFSEGDVLLVIETNPEDRNWVKARHESTGEIGFIPAAYVRPVGADDLGEQRAAAAASSQSDSVTQHDRQLAESNGDWAEEIEPQYKPNEVYRQMTIRTHSRGLCRAKYNYTAEPNMFEEDGYPHLSLKRGEIMAIIDQGEDDGWWLVEKQAKNAPAEEARGHVPSMLVEEVAPGQEHIALAREQNPSDDSDVSDDDDDDADEDDDDEESYDDDGPVKGPPPSFEPPVLKQDQDDDSPTGPQPLEQANGGSVEGKFNEHSNDDCDEAKRGPANDGGEMAKSDQDEQAVPDSGQGQESTKSTDNNSSLIPTSFIIIEPTPEVESRKFEDNLYKQDDEETGVAGSSVASGTNSSKTKSEAEGEKDSQTITGRDADATDKKQQQHRDQSTRQVVHSRQPSSQVNYSIVNEDFVLEKPTRRPYQHSASNSIDNASSKHHEPTIEEEEDTCQNETNSMSSRQVQSHDGNNGGGDDNDDCQMRTNMPAPPSVVIDSVEAIPRSPDLSFDEEAGGSGGGGDDGDGDEDESQRSDVSASEKKPIKHTNYANVSPILRHHAEEFCKQLIEEAIMLAPGSQIGPSTSSANVSIDGRITCDANEDDYHNDYEHNDGSFDEST